MQDKEDKRENYMSNDLPLIPKFMENPEILKRILVAGIGKLATDDALPYKEATMFLMSDCVQDICVILSNVLVEENKKFEEFCKQENKG
jgi:hypothetical protein